MSTPKTDAREKDYWDTPTSHVDDVWEFARQLERELEVANNWVTHHQNHVDDLIKENAAMRKALADAEIVAEYEGEDGRRDWWGSGYWLHTGKVLVCMDRDAIDAARKEAQP